MSVNQHDMSRQTADNTDDNNYSLISIKEAAKIAHVTERTVNRLIASNDIQSIKSGKRRLIWRDSVLTWRRHCQDPSSRGNQETYREVLSNIAELKHLLIAVIELYQPESISKLTEKIALKRRA